MIHHKAPYKGNLRHIHSQIVEPYCEVKGNLDGDQNCMLTVGQHLLE